jgi:hypothetical protein
MLLLNTALRFPRETKTRISSAHPYTSLKFNSDVFAGSVLGQPVSYNIFVSPRIDLPIDVLFFNAFARGSLFVVSLARGNIKRGLRRKFTGCGFPSRRPETFLSLPLIFVRGLFLLFYRSHVLRATRNIVIARAAAAHW